MSEPRITVEGADRFALTTRAAARRLNDLEKPGQESATLVGSRSRAGAPRRTGRLTGSIRTDVRDGTVTTGSGLPYANRTHWGYRRYNQAAQPFITTAVINNQTMIVDKYADHIEVCLGGIHGK